MDGILAKILILTFSLHISTSSRILIGVMSQGRSHIQSAVPLAQRLIEDGHEVAAHFIIFEPELPIGKGIREELVQLRGDNVGVGQDPVFVEMMWNDDVATIGYLIVWRMAVDSCRQLIHGQPDDFWRIANQTWDLVLVDDIFAPCAVALAKLSNAPYAIFSPSVLMPVTAYRLQLGRVSTDCPLFLTHDKASWSVEHFFDRLEAALEKLQLILVHPLVIDRWIDNLLTPIISNFTYGQFHRESAFATFDYPDRFNWHSPTRHDVLSVGNVCKATRTLPTELEDFVSDANSKGTILVAFGTIARFEMAPKHVFDAFTESLAHLTDYRILWSYSGADLKLPPHVRLQKWLPQNDILAHRNTKLFLTHGGLKSLKESVCAGVPVVLMPLFAEQIRNALLARKFGFGEYLNKKNVTKHQILHRINQVIHGNHYRENAVKLKTLWMDRILPSLDEAAFWTQRVLNGKRFPQKFFKNPDDIYLFSSLHLDLLVIPLLLHQVFLLH